MRSTLATQHHRRAHEEPREYSLRSPPRRAYHRAVHSVERRSADFSSSYGVPRANSAVVHLSWGKAGAVAGEAAVAKQLPLPSSCRARPNKGKRQGEKAGLIKDGRRLSHVLRHRATLQARSAEPFAWHRLKDVAKESRLTLERIRLLVGCSKKGVTPRYQILADADRELIRATYGHSFKVLQDDVLSEGNERHRRGRRHLDDEDDDEAELYSDGEDEAHEDSSHGAEADAEFPSWGVAGVDVVKDEIKSEPDTDRRRRPRC